MLARTRDELNRIAQAKRKGDAEKIGARVGKLLAKTRMGKFVVWSVEDGCLVWRFDEDKIAAEKLFDGCYIICGTVPAERMSRQELVASYKSLALVETAFRNLKTVQLEVRPVYHKTDERAGLNSVLVRKTWTEHLAGEDRLARLWTVLMYIPCLSG